MTLSRHAWVGAAALLALTGCAAATAPAATDTAAITLWKDFSDKPRGYLENQAAGAETYLAPPPAAGSARQGADMAVYRATRLLEGSDRWRQAQADANIDSPTAAKAFECALGAQIDPLRQPILVRMLARISTDSDNLSRSAKVAFARRRPFLIEEAAICIPRDRWMVTQGSYPSGHAATGWLWGLVLTELAPDRAGALLRRARSFGESRVVCGVHYVSDVEAGRDVASASLARLRGDPAFAADLATARRELAAARATTAAPASCAARDALDAPVY